MKPGQLTNIYQNVEAYVRIAVRMVVHDAYEYQIGEPATVPIGDVVSRDYPGVVVEIDYAHDIVVVELDMVEPLRSAIAYAMYKALESGGGVGQ